MDLMLAIYRVSQSWPKEERFGLTAQIRSAAVSIPSNIAEGKGRNRTLPFIQFLDTAYGSLCEVETQLEAAARLGYVDRATYDQLAPMCVEVGKLINGLINAMERRRDET